MNWDLYGGLMDMFNELKELLSYSKHILKANHVNVIDGKLWVYGDYIVAPWLVYSGPFPEIFEIKSWIDIDHAIGMCQLPESLLKLIYNY
jgi:hypothetical protein